MQFIAAERPFTRADRIALARGGVAAFLLVVTGAFLGWAVVTTPILSAVMPGVRPTPSEMIVGVLAWSLAILLPFGFVILGLARAFTALEVLEALRPDPRLPKLARELGEDHLVVTGLRLPDGRWIPELVLGPFGIAVVAPAPPRGGTRRIGDRWELRGARGRWVPIENPVERAGRDAERVRRWLGGYDQDFVVKVHAALVSADPTIPRTPTTAVIGPDQVAAWLRALPPQRGLTDGRRQTIANLIREAASVR